jgi:hypothetical protein
MDREHIAAEIGKLNISQRATMRKLVVSVVPQRDRVRVKTYDKAATVFVNRDGIKTYVHLGPRGRIIERKVWL